MGYLPNTNWSSDLELLDLSHCGLRGPIPASFRNLTQIISVDLHGNSLEGQIPNELSVVIILKNKLTRNIPSSICNLSSLGVLDLSENSLSGTILDFLGNFSYLKLLDLQSNNFIGKIPNSFMNYSELSHLLLNDNQLEGLVPPSLANCTLLELLNLGNDKLTNRFPRWLASLPSLQVLILIFSRFCGSLPHSIASSSFSTLRIINFSRNKVTGILSTKLLRNLEAMKDKPKDWLYSHFCGIIEIPVNVTMKRLETKLIKTVGIFASMDLSNNEFCGKNPKAIGKLIFLQMLNFSHNNFSDPIPTSFRNLVALESLDLSSNKLSGRIPSQVTKLTFFEVLNFSNNNLIGKFLMGINTIRLIMIPIVVTWYCAGFEIPLFWQVVMMGYGSGVVLGLSLGYIVFTTGKPWWFVKKVERDWQYNFTSLEHDLKHLHTGVAHGRGLVEPKSSSIRKKAILRV
ncbi:hypothetical protein CXB51_021834 [Gossypium anomalum]|uniref:Uncharacterized protein n=1 Tax=Gossypium anomalum TaxID=47600 RepID=A0A8J5YM76_9ROSI|nr:hypothetical protein CXB51_021834 [Gossypium anomalum]